MSKVEIIKGTAFELKPEKNYIILFAKTDLTKEDAVSLNGAVQQLGAKNVTVLVDMPENVRVLEVVPDEQVQS